MLQSLNDTSTFYGGDVLPEFSIGGTFGFEIEIPSFYTLETHVDIINVEINTSVGYLNDDGDFTHLPEDSTTSGLSNYSVVERSSDVDTDNMLELIRIQNYQDFEISFENLTYPLTLADIEYDLSLANIEVVINEKLIDHETYVKDLEENTLTINSGPSISSGTVIIRIILTDPMVCHKGCEI